MAWHEVIAWIIIVVAVITALIWLLRRIFCPQSRCEGCDKSCPKRRKL